MQGTWENDNLSGNATFYHAQHQRTDQGTFCGTFRNGRGTMTLSDGNIYEDVYKRQALFQKDYYVSYKLRKALADNPHILP